LRTQRDTTSANLEFEAAAALHAQVQRVESIRALAPELVRALSQLRAVVLQASANPGEVDVFLYENGRLSGPAGFSTLGMRIQNEQSGSTSLFAHPMAIEAIPEAPVAEPIAYTIAENDFDSGSVLCQGTTSVVPQMPQTESGALAPEESSSENVLTHSETGGDAPAKSARGVLEARMETALAALAESSGSTSATLRQGHLALLKRWYYRAEIRRSGEIFFPDAEGRWPVKAMLRGVGRIAGKMLVAGKHTD
jgi:hypothetical protein